MLNGNAGLARDGAGIGTGTGRGIGAGPRGAPPPLLDPAPLPRGRGWAWWLGAGISLAVLVAVVVQLRNVDFGRVLAILPTGIGFWLVFAAAYLVGPAADWLIFRRLWRMPASGFVALLRKLIGNELVFGYVGELYLYSWARRRTEMTSAPFGAIKDVAILSAMAANVVTLVLFAICWPMLGELDLGLDPSIFAWSVAIILGPSTLVLLLRRTLFSSPRRDLAYVGAVHLARILIQNGLTALAWHLALPAVALQWWLVLAALRMLLARLPALPNKDIVFAAVAVFLVGRDAEIGTLMTMMASLILATHLALGLVLVLGEANAWRRRR
jgi:hypothetical protein